MKTLGKTINKIRTEAKLTQEQFSQIFGVSQQSVQRWESGVSSPDLEKIIMISKYFGISLDALVLGNDNRVVDEMKKTKVISRMRLHVQAQNLFTITKFSGIDPEGASNIYAAQYPMSRQYTCGLELTF